MLIWMRYAATILRKLLSVLAGIFSLLVLLSARTRSILDLSVVAREYGHLFAIPALLSGLRYGHMKAARRRRIKSSVSLAQGVVLLLPLLLSLRIARKLPEQLIGAFGTAAAVPPSGSSGGSSPISLARLLRPWQGGSTGGVEKSTMVYGRVDNRELELTLYRGPKGPGDEPLPCVVVIPGGSWRHVEKVRFNALNSYLASRGYAVARVDYRTAPQHRFPAAFEDVRRAVAYMKENAQRLGVDPERIALLGRSAGAQLALLMAYTDRDRAIRGVVSFYGPTDLSYAYTHPTNPRVADIQELLESYLGGSPRDESSAYRDASPINFVGPDSPPTLLIHGSRDEIVRPAQSLRLAARLREAGVGHLLVRLPWATHGFDYNLYGPGGQVSTYAVEAFLAAVLRRPGPGPGNASSGDPR